MHSILCIINTAIVIFHFWTANDSQSTTNNKTDDGSPPAYSYPVDAPPPYPQQSGYPGQPVHQVQPGYSDPPGYAGQPGYHAPPGYPGQPMYHGAPMGGFMVSTAVCSVLLIFIYKFVNWLLNIIMLFIVMSVMSQIMVSDMWIFLA